MFGRGIGGGVCRGDVRGRREVLKRNNILDVYDSRRECVCDSGNMENGVASYVSNDQPLAACIWL